MTIDPPWLRLSCQAIRAIQQNLVFSLGMLVLVVGLTIPGFLTPVAGALLHELSSLPVLANSARLIGLKEQSGEVAGKQGWLKRLCSVDQGRGAIPFTYTQVIVPQRAQREIFSSSRRPPRLCGAKNHWEYSNDDMATQR